MFAMGGNVLSEPGFGGAVGGTSGIRLHPGGCGDPVVFGIRLPGIQSVLGQAQLASSPSQ